MEDIGERKSCRATTLIVTTDSADGDGDGDGDTVGDGDIDKVIVQLAI
jgi:hypothetical protein